MHFVAEVHVQQEREPYAVPFRL